MMINSYGTEYQGHAEHWYQTWIPKTRTAELERLLASPYGQQPDVSWRLEAELARREETRPEPAPGKPKPIPRGLRAGVTTTRDPDNLAAKIIDAGRKRRGEVEPASEPTGLAARIVRAGKRRRGEIE